MTFYRKGCATYHRQMWYAFHFPQFQEFEEALCNGETLLAPESLSMDGGLALAGSS